MQRSGAVIAAVLTIIILSVFAYVSADGLWRPDAFDYAQIAREIADGNGFSSRQIIYALHFEFLKQHELLQSDWPNVHRFPLPSLVMAGLFLVFGATDTAVMAYGIIFNAGISALLWIWGRRAIGPAAAIGAVVLFVLNGVMMETGISGLSEPPVMFFFTLALYGMWRWRHSRHWGWALGVGAALGLAALGRTNVIIAAPMFVLFLAWPDGKSRFALRPVLVSAVAIIAGMVVVMGPWLIRNWQVAGSPLYSLHSYFLLPATKDPSGDKSDLTIPWVTQFTPPIQYLRANASIVWDKWLTNVMDLLRAFPMVADTFLVSLLALAALAFEPGRKLRSIAVLLFACFIANALLVSFTDTYFDKYHFHFLPVMMLLAAGLVWRALGRLPEPYWQRGVFIVIIAAMIHLPGTRDAYQRVHSNSRRIDHAHMDFIRNSTPEDALIMSDQSYAVTWEAQRRSVRNHIDKVSNGAAVLGAARLSEQYARIDAIYLSADYMNNTNDRTILMQSMRYGNLGSLFPEHLWHWFEIDSSRQYGAVLLRRAPSPAP